MRFITWGDYIIPTEWAIYWAKHIYTWSFQSGTPNPDGVIRLPGRLLNFLVYGLTDNVGLGYFYLFASLATAFLAFFFFVRKFLKVEQTSVQLLSALFFAFNPIFLGNLAKVGLILAVAMLPLSLLAIRATFIQRRFRYLLLYILCLNLSFLHPYTFVVNLAVSGMYALVMAWQHRAWVRDVWQKLLLVGLFAIGINAYFILPMADLGTVSKDVISTDVQGKATDYTALVGVANTGDLFTGFSLSKNVFVDFSFYDSTYQNVYFFGVFSFYVLLFGLYLYTEKQLKLGDKRRLGVMFGGFLLLLLLAATTVAHFDKLITFLINMPGGWAFRSPLKWQLYIPLVLFGILAVLLSRVADVRRRALFIGGLLVPFVIMNGYLAADISYKLLTPRSPEYFAALAEADLDGKTILFVNNGECMDFRRTYPRIDSELNQIFNSKNTQLKHLLEGSTDAVNMGTYDYVIDCFDHMERTLTESYNYQTVASFVDGVFRLYANQQPVKAVAAADTAYSLDSQKAIGSKYHFATGSLSGTFNFAPTATDATTGLSDIFEELRPEQVDRGVIRTQVAGGQQIRMREHETVYYQLDGTTLRLANSPQPGLEAVEDSRIDLPSTTTYNIVYGEPGEAVQLIPNGSLEDGLWQDTVGDCYAYDDKPSISMRLNKNERTAGNQSLELSARRHIACTGPDDIAVTEGQHYLLSFDYYSPAGSRYAGFYLSFDDPDETSMLERMRSNDTGWQSFSKEIAVPEGATKLRLLLYTFPESYGEKTRTVFYDNVSLVPIPPAQNRFYTVTEPKTVLQKPRELTYHIENPTRTTVQIKGASQPFYLTTNESYHPNWQAELLDSNLGIQLPFTQRQALEEGSHIALNNAQNAWYIDPVALCSQSRGCSQNDDGSYDFTLAIEFTPQRWLYFGIAVSAITLAAGSAYYLHDRRRSGKFEEGRWQWYR